MGWELLHRKNRNKGQSTVELALVLPVLLAVLLGLIDMAFLIQGYLTVSHAAHAAARFAITYQPNQGECIDHNGNGVAVDEPWPYCPSPGYGENPYESDDDYYARRVKLIKLKAVEEARGLRTSVICDGNPVESWNCIQIHMHDPGMLGVQVWGLPAYDSAAEEDHPGLRGLPVRVRVIHNVPLVVYAPLLPNGSVRVSSSVEMINEGVQVGYGNEAPPTIPSDQTLEPPGTPPATVTPLPTPTPGPSPTPTEVPVYHLELNFSSATNTLPDERAHAVGAHVTNEAGANVAGARVTFSTDAGSFDYSGTGTQVVEVSTGGDGWAWTTIYANEPLVANIHAWLDYNGNGAIDANEPSDSATKTWTVNGPYLIVSDHNPPPGAWIGVEMYDHPTSYNPYSLWWCPTSPTSTQIIRQLAYPIDVDTNGYYNASVQVPVGVVGSYRIESHSGDGGADGCADSASLVAYSAPIEIAETPVDLTVSGISITTPPSERFAGVPMTVVISVTNLSPAPLIGELFDVDIYVGLDAPPSQGELGLQKQWLSDVGGLETVPITFSLTLYDMGASNLYAQVDTTDYIEESDETNNVAGPLDFTLDCALDRARSDDFDGGLGSQWQTANVNSYVNGSNWVDGDGRLNLRSRGYTIWSGNNSFYYIYQEYTGDFDARLRIYAHPTTASWAKAGLHVRRGLETNAPYVMNVATNNRSPAGTQFAYRDIPGGSAGRVAADITVPMPYWVRLVRTGRTYDYYYYVPSDPDDRPTIDDWIHVGTHTTAYDYPYIGIANASYSSHYGTGIVDDFLICTEDSVPSGGGDEIYPPGLEVCKELITIPGFEGNSETVYEYWHAGNPGAFQRTSQQFYEGSFSMRLHASLGVYPCSNNILQPYLYQDVEMPTDVFSFTTFVVDGRYYVDKSSLECSPGGPDPDDVLYLRLQDTSGSDLMSSPVVITHGGAISQTWLDIETDLSPYLDIESLAGQTVRLYWNATHDQDYNGTFFYLDNLSAQVCTRWPIPDPVPGTATFGGLITTLNENNIFVPVPGADVWAYARGGEVYRTRSIQDGTYHFYNIPPGTYVVYAQAVINGEVRYATTEITVAADERRDDVNLLLN
jgi:hypothetical protein